MIWWIAVYKNVGISSSNLHLHTLFYMCEGTKAYPLTPFKHEKDAL
jgi:hypothetical protein